MKQLLSFYCPRSPAAGTTLPTSASVFEHFNYFIWESHMVFLLLRWAPYTYCNAVHGTWIKYGRISVCSHFERFCYCLFVLFVLGKGYVAQAGLEFSL